MSTPEAKARLREIRAQFLSLEEPEVARASGAEQMRADLLREARLLERLLADRHPYWRD